MYTSQPIGRDRRQNYADYGGAVPAGVITKSSVAQTTTATANKVYLLNFLDSTGASIFNGTNKVAAIEITAYKNDYTVPGATSADYKMYIVRENSSDGASPSTSRKEEASSINGTAKITSDIQDWATTKAMLYFSSSGTYQISAKALYYTV